MEKQITCRVRSDLFDKLSRRAQAEGISRSELVRLALESYLGVGRKVKNYPYARVRDLIGTVTGGPPDLAERHREYLAGILRGRR